jgi:BirA family biotin operon repressor/biotin-[acetyl-CoA-carboxylase] ligase
LIKALLTFEQHGFAAFAARFAKRDALAGRAVRLSNGTEGVAEGVAPDGALLVRTLQGLRRVSSDEVSVRPRALS